MRKKLPGGRALIGVVAFILVAAIIFGGTVLLERRQQGAVEKELTAQRANTTTDFWTAENTVFLDGERYGFDHRIESYLFVGTDNSGSAVYSDNPEDYHGPMADFLLLMVIDHTDNTIGYIQIDRNTVTDVYQVDAEGNVEFTRMLQICTAHWLGHSPQMCAELTVNAVKNYLGGLADIDGYFVINMDDIGKLNHTVGGVEVTIEDDMDAADPTFVKGSTVMLDDETAERFLRARMSVGEGQNAERMSRQRQYMGAFFEKVKQKTLDNPKFGLDFFNALKSVAETNMNGTDFSRIAQKLLKGEDKGIRTIDGETIIGQLLDDGEDHEEFYAYDDSIRDVMIDMYSLEMIPFEDYLDADFEDDEDYDDEDGEDEDGDIYFEDEDDESDAFIDGDFDDEDDEDYDDIDDEDIDEDED